jgi:predicted HicB family RNase H-like nuclease
MTTETIDGFVWMQVSDEHYDALAEIAELEGCSMNDLLAEALERLVEAYE